MGNYEENLSELKRFLGQNLFVNKSAPEHPIKQSLKRILDFHQQADYANRDYENASISLLIKNLREIEGHHDKKLLKLLLKALQTSNNDTYFGIRLEISVAASLIRSNTSFDKTEHPDFTLHGEFDGAFIECSSAHLSSPKLKVKDLKYKIGAIINEKAKYDYCNNGTTLFIDFTNINYHSTLNDVLLDNNELKHYVAKELSHINFGSVLLWFFMINIDNNRYQWKYHRIDSKSQKQVLSKFLDRLYPFGYDVTHNYGFLERG